MFLPTAEERQDVVAIHLAKRCRDANALAFDTLIAATIGITAADIELVIVTALKLEFHAMEVLTTEHLLDAIPEVRPLSQTDPERVTAITEWLERHTTRASEDPEDDCGITKQRQRARRVAV